MKYTCADDVMARDKLVQYQDNYAAAMAKYGLERGIRGSDARHVGTQQYYRDLFDKNENLKECIESKAYQIEDMEKKIHDMYELRDEAKDKFLTIDQYVHQREKDLKQIESKLQQAQMNYEPYKAQEELNTIHKLFPMMKEQLRIANLCEKIGLGIEYIRMLFESRNLTAKSYSFFSPKHNRKFEATHIKLKIEKEADNPNKLKLTLNGINILDWFKLKYKELQEKLKLTQNKNRGFRM